MRYIAVGGLVVLFAVSAYSQSRRAPEPRRAPTVPEQVAELRGELADLTRRVESLEAEVRGLRGGANGEAPDADVARGIRDKKIAVGMTVRQVEQIIGSAGEMKADSGTTKRYVWFVPPTLKIIRDRDSMPAGGLILTVDFVNGKLATYRTTAAEPAGAR